MSLTHISAELRRLVVARAEGLCEYCLISEDDTFLGCEIDHIISEKHGGPTREDNLAYACVVCNQAKGSDIASVDWSTDTIIPLFDPRKHRWSEHFVLAEGRIEPRTPIGAVTARILRFNTRKRLLEREMLLSAKRFPSVAA